MPVFTIFAGPNGAGKSSIIRRVDFAGRGNLLEADAIALRIHPANPGQVATAAGREVLLRTRGYLAAGQDFGVETTLSGASIIRAIKQAITRGFFVRLVYICLESPEQCIQRVHERVAQGGHNVPDEDVRRRYARSLVNLKQVTKIANETLVYDNSGPEPVLVLEVRSGRVTTEAKELPVWARNLLDAVS